MAQKTKQIPQTKLISQTKLVPQTKQEEQKVLVANMNARKAAFTLNPKP